MPRQDSELRLKVIHTADDNDLFEGCRHVLCCLSGGLDSCVLLHVLMSLRERYGFLLSALHVNHGIRGDEADRDEEFCRRLCSGLDVPFYSRRVDVPEYARQNRLSTELAARSLRYEAIYSVMRTIGADAAATAHNADDNAETLLYNIIRGTTPSGICAIPYKRDGIIRPLLCVSRSEIEDYAKRYSIDHVEDSTNGDDEYTRNFIRHNIIPLCKEVNPSFLGAVTRLTDAAKRDERLISESGIDVRRRVVDFLEKNGVRGVNNDMIVKLSKAALAGGSREFTLTGGVKVAAENGQLRMVSENVSAFYGDAVLAEGVNSFADGAVSVTVEESFENFREIYKSFTTIGFISAIINRSVITVRNRKEGDCVTVSGVRKSVKKELINRKIPRAMRELIPVVCVDGRTAFVPYVGVDDSFAPDAGKSIKISVLFGALPSGGSSD